MSERPTLPDVLRAAAWLLEHPERWQEFKERFSVATCEAALGMAERAGVPDSILAKVRKDLGLG